MKKLRFNNSLNSNDFEKTATAVSLVSIIGNAALTAFKMLAGILAHSSAMISDAIHSASDILSSIIVIIGVKLSAKKSDDDHHYGHEKFECVAAVVLAIILLITGIFIGHTGIESLTAEGQLFEIPGVLALVAAIISIVSKEAMFRYTRFYAKKLSSGALMADAWHHRSDALSSIGSFAGILGARMGFPKLDTIASIVIGAFIIKASYDIFKDAISKMTDKACDTETETKIKECALSQDGVMGIDLIHTRVFANKVYVDIEICADKNITLTEAHDIAENVHVSIEDSFPIVKHITVHVNPI